MEKDEYKNYQTKFHNRVISDRALTSTEKLVYATIRSFGDWGDGKNCYPKIEQVAERAGVSEKTVDRSILVLKKAGYLTWKKGHTGTSNDYSFPQEPIFPQGTPVTLARVKHDAIRGSRVTHHQDQTKNYNQGENNFSTIRMDGYPNCKICGDPEPMCICQK